MSEQGSFNKQIAPQNNVRKPIEGEILLTDEAAFEAVRKSVERVYEDSPELKSLAAKQKAIDVDFHVVGVDKPDQAEPKSFMLNNPWIEEENSHNETLRSLDFQ